MWAGREHSPVHRGERLGIAVPSTPVRSCGQELTRPGARGRRPPGAVNRSCSQRRRRHPDGSRGCQPRAWLREPHRSPWGCRRFRGDGRSRCAVTSTLASPLGNGPQFARIGYAVESGSATLGWPAYRAQASRGSSMHLCRDVHHPVILGSDVPGYRTNPARNRKAGGDDCRATGRNG